MVNTKRKPRLSLVGNKAQRQNVGRKCKALTTWSHAERAGWRATGGEGEGPGVMAVATAMAQTSRLRSLGGAGEETQGRAEECWRAGVLAPPFSPEKGGERCGKLSSNCVFCADGGGKPGSAHGCLDMFSTHFGHDPFCIAKVSAKLPNAGLGTISVCTSKRVDRTKSLTFTSVSKLIDYLKPFLFLVPAHRLIRHYSYLPIMYSSDRQPGCRLLP